jgi:RNA polymerase sigma-70 factor (ECF subfamily)
MTDAERQAVARAKAGDGDAFGVVVRLHSRTLFRTAARLVGSAAAAEDVVQETFLRAYRALARFDDRHDLLPWLQRIAVNAAIDEVRRAHREMPLGRRDADGEWSDLDPADAAPSPEREAASAGIGRAAARALGDLSEDERTAFVLRHLEGRPIAEISRALGKGDNATKQSIFRAVRKLRRALAAWTEVPREELA